MPGVEDRAARASGGLVGDDADGRGDFPAPRVRLIAVAADAAWAAWSWAVSVAGWYGESKGPSPPPPTVPDAPCRAQEQCGGRQGHLGAATSPRQERRDHDEDHDRRRRSADA